VKNMHHEHGQSVTSVTWRMFQLTGTTEQSWDDKLVVLNAGRVLMKKNALVSQPLVYGSVEALFSLHDPF